MSQLRELLCIHDALGDSISARQRCYAHSLVVRPTNHDRARAERELRHLGRRWKRSKGLLDACGVVDATSSVDWGLHDGEVVDRWFAVMLRAVNSL